MNWKRIVLFGLGVFLVSMAVPNVIEPPIIAGRGMILFVAAATIPIVVLSGWLALIQRERTVLHVGLAVEGGWLLSFLPSATSRSAEPIVWLLSLLACAVMAGIGLGLGVSLRKLRGAG